MRQKAKKLLNKSISAAVAAIEIYNKPNFEYREENFCILMLNAWELLLKAKLIEENQNIFKKENGADKINRSGNKMTLDVFEAIKLINKINVQENVSESLRGNIEVLTEIRDNSIHFYNPDLHLAKKVLEVGTASLKSYTSRVQLWFNHGLEKYNFFLMPISFYHESEIESFSVSNSTKLQKNLLKFILDKEHTYKPDPNRIDNISLRLETKFVRTSNPETLEVRITNNPDAPAMQISEEQLIKKYCWPYYKLGKELAKRFCDFQQNDKYHRLRKSIYGDSKYHWQRLNNPLHPEKGGSNWFCPEVLNFFSKYYTKK